MADPPSKRARLASESFSVLPAEALDKIWTYFESPDEARNLTLAYQGVLTSYCGAVTSIAFGNGSQTPTDLQRMISGFPSVKSLRWKVSMMDVAMSSEFLQFWSQEELARAGQITRFEIEHCRDGRDVLACDIFDVPSKLCPFLEEIVIRRQCAPLNLMNIVSFVRLRSLALVEVTVNIWSFAVLTNLPNLTSLSLQFVDLPERIYWKLLKKMDRLQNFILIPDSRSESEKFMSWRSIPSSVESLTMSWPPTDSPSDSFEHLGRLSCLSLCSSRRLISLEKFKTIGHQLTMLDLHDQEHLPDRAVYSVLKSIPNLKWISTDFCPLIGDETAIAIANSSTLQVVSLVGTAVTSLGMEMIARGTVRRTLSRFRPPKKCSCDGIAGKLMEDCPSFASDSLHSCHGEKIEEAMDALRIECMGGPRQMFPAGVSHNMASGLGWGKVH
jgi:hypothetical protein